MRYYPKVTRLRAAAVAACIAAAAAAVWLCCALPGRSLVLSNRGPGAERSRQSLAGGGLRVHSGRALGGNKKTENAHAGLRARMRAYAARCFVARKHLSQRRLVSIHRAALIRRAALSCAELQGPRFGFNPMICRLSVTATS